MQRKIIQSLENWKHKTNRKPLIIQGARQVGKTWAMKHFGEHSFEKVAGSSSSFIAMIQLLVRR